MLFRSNSNLVITANSNDAQLSSPLIIQLTGGKTGIFPYTVTTSENLNSCNRCLLNYLADTNTTGSVKYRIMVVEGDYTNYDFTDYDSTKGGKYKVDYKVTGKNKFNVADMLQTYFAEVGVIPTIENEKIILNGTATSIYDFRPIASGWNEKAMKYVSNLPVGTNLTISNNLNLENYWSLKRNGTITYIKDSLTIQKDRKSTRLNSSH